MINRENESDEDGIIGRIELARPSIESIDEPLHPKQTTDPSMILTELEGLEPKRNNLKTDTANFLGASGRGRYVQAMEGRDLSQDSMLWAIRKSRGNLEVRLQRQGIAVFNPLHPQAEMYLRRIPSAEIKAIDNILAANGTPRTAIKSREVGGHFKPETTMLTTTLEFQTGRSVERIFDELDSQSQEILTLESEADLLRAELDGMEMEFETGAPELTDEEYLQLKDKRRAEYDELKKELAEAFVEIQVVKQMIISFSSRDKDWGASDAGREIERQSRSGIDVMASRIDFFRRFINEEQQFVEQFMRGL